MSPMDGTTPTLTNDELRRMNAYWRACNYLCAGMLYLRANPLLREPLKVEHIKNRLLGHWGSDPGQSFTWVHLNRLIKKYDLNMIYISGPGHGAPATLSNSYLEGVYSEVYPDKSRDEQGMLKFFKQFSFPGGIGSHCTPETPGSIHEGGELGYSLSHGFGAAFDNPDLIVTVVVGDGEAETGPLATSWHSNKFLNPIHDGAVLPILHLNGYKIANPTILARISPEELDSLFKGYGWKPYVVEGDDPAVMHETMATVLEQCVLEIRAIQKKARETGSCERPRWPMIVLRSPKGWTGPRKIDSKLLEGFWRAHQIPIPDVASNPAHLKILEDWMKSYNADEAFGKDGKLIPELKALAPTGNARMSANPVGNGGLLRKPLDMPDFRKYALPNIEPGISNLGSMVNMAKFLRDIVAKNMTNFRVFGPDETESNKLGEIYKAGKKVWMGEYFEEDSDGGNLAMEGRVMEMLSEHTCEGWMEGYVLSGRHGLLNSYEPFIHIIDSMVNQHCKWIEKCNEVEWRVKVASLNILLTATVWRQDHNGFTHQDPGFLDVVANKSPEVVRIYLPPDGNTLLSVTDHCLRSTNYVNVAPPQKQKRRSRRASQRSLPHSELRPRFEFARPRFLHAALYQEPNQPTAFTATAGLMLKVSGENDATGVRADGIAFARVQIFYMADTPPATDIKVWVSPSNGDISANPIIISKNQLMGEAHWTSKSPIAAAKLSIVTTNPKVPFAGSTEATVIFGAPKQASDTLKREGLNYFFFSRELGTSRTDLLPVSQLFAPDQIGNYLGIKWTDGTSYLLTWLGPDVQPISPAFRSVRGVGRAITSGNNEASAGMQ